MKLKHALFLAFLGVLTFSGCGIIGPLPERTYAELRIGDDGKIQLLIESDQWMGIVNPLRQGGNQHWIQEWYTLQGDGPIYDVSQDKAEHASDTGTITIDQEHKIVTLNIEVMPAPGSMLAQKKPNMWNGTYRITSVNHDPFYSNDNRK